MITKLISPFNIQGSKTVKENTKNLSNLIHGNTQRLSMKKNENFNPVFEEYYLVGPILGILMALNSIDLANS